MPNSDFLDPYKQKQSKLGSIGGGSKVREAKCDHTELTLYSGGSHKIAFKLKILVEPLR